LLGITGHSGAGKSTFCLAMNGLIPHVVEGVMRGTVKIGGLDTRSHDVSDYASIVGVVFQDPRSQLTGSAMTVEEEVAFGLQNLGIQRGVMKDRIAEALQLVGLQGLESRSPFELSGGEQQRLSLATVIATRPKIMVLDEPTEMLDPEGKTSVMKAIHRIHERGHRTTVLVTNQPETLLTYADTITVFCNGGVASVNTPQEFANKVRYLEKLGVRPSQLCQVAAFLDEKGLWEGNYPMNVNQAVESIDRHLLRS
jgi:energy-coupling factor transport system ATP-binding protein